MDTALPGIIRGYNEAVGGVNDDTQGYHDTITRAYLAGVRWWLREHGSDPLLAQINRMLTAEVGARDWPLRFYSRERLFSVAARQGFVEPDLRPLP